MLHSLAAFDVDGAGRVNAAEWLDSNVKSRLGVKVVVLNHAECKGRVDRVHFGGSRPTHLAFEVVGKAHCVGADG